MNRITKHNNASRTARNWTLRDTIENEICPAIMAAQVDFENEATPRRTGRPVGTVGGNARMTDGGRRERSASALAEYGFGIISANAGE